MIKGFILCGYARTGGTLLCRALHATGRFGYAQEYFNKVAIEPIAGLTYPADPVSQLAEIGKRGTAPNGVYGLKLFADQFDSLRGFDWLSPLPNPVFIHLERRDALGQALSNVRALQTHQWNIEHRERYRPHYDETAILEELSRAAYFRARWQMFFARNGIEPLWLTYEEVVADLPGTVLRIARLLEIDDLPEVPPADAVLQRQADALSDEWRARFVASRGNPTFLDRPAMPRSGQAARRWLRRWIKG